MTLPWQGTTPEISTEYDSRYETPGGAQNKVNVSQEYLLHLLKLAVTGLSNGSEAAIARYSTPYDITYDWLKDRLDTTDTRLIQLDYLNAEERNILTVAKVGGQFSTINDAIDYASSYCTVSNRVTIMVSSGIYNEEIILMPNPGIDIIGSGSDSTTVSFASSYPNSPIFTVGKGYFQDIGFICATSGVNSYALHFESQLNAEVGLVKFVNCSFLSYNNSGVGIGLGQDTGLQFVGCDIASVGFPAVYAHNYPNNNVNNQLLEIRNTKITGYGTSICARIDDAAKLSSYSNSKMTITVANCESGLPHIKYNNGSTELNYIPKTGTDITLNTESTNTNILGFNYNEADTTIGGICFVGGNGLFTIPISYAPLRDYTVLTAIRTDDSFDIASTVSVVGTGEKYVVFLTSDTTVRGNSININLKTTAK